METYSQVKQDRWVLSIFPRGYRGFFLDIGCNLPRTINNTLLLERRAWTGVAIDIIDYSRRWRRRKARFIRADAMTCDFNSMGLPQVIDYLSLDIDGIGTNYKVLNRLLDAGFVFKAITIEHNLYIGERFNRGERLPQRKLLHNMGYILDKPDVAAFDGNIFEDWWVNKKYI